MLRLYCSLIALLLVVSLQVYGSISRGSLKSVTKTDAAGNNVTTQFCQRPSGNYSIGQNWTVDFPDCLECQCKASGWICYGYGIKAAVIDLDEGYELAPNTCTVTPVKINKTTTPCGCGDSTGAAPAAAGGGGKA